MRKRIVKGGRNVLFSAVAMSAFLTACRGAGESAGGRSGEGGPGTISADGSSTVFPITQVVAEIFQERDPSVRISVGTSGTGGGFEKFCRSETDISDASRPIEQQEAQSCAENDIEFVELAVALDGLSVVVNPQNDFVRCLTVGELRSIWRPKSRIKNWSQVRDGFPRRPLKLYGAGTDSGTFDYFSQVIVGTEGASRDDYVASEDDNILVQGIAGDENGLGYFGYAYYAQNKSLVKALAVDSGGGCVRPTAGTIRSGEYRPLSRPLYIYVSKTSASRPEVRAFVNFYLAQVEELAPEVGYLALQAEQLEQERQKWQSFLQGPSDANPA